MEQNYSPSKTQTHKQKKSDQVFMRTLRRLSLSILLCMFCVVSTTWAWFVSTSESHVSTISVKKPSVTAVSTASTYFRRSPVREVLDGRTFMPAGEYLISAEPLSGTSPMYCLIAVKTEGSVNGLAEEVIEVFNEDMDERWVPVRASSSNAICIFDEDELETFIEEFEEENDEAEYEILPISVVKDGIYRVDWEPEEERTFTLEIKQDALIKIQVFWLTEDSEEDEYPSLDELNGWNYSIVRPKRESSSSNARKSSESDTKKNETVKAEKESTKSETGTVTTETEVGKTETQTPQGSSGEQKENLETLETAKASDSNAEQK